MIKKHQHSQEFISRFCERFDCRIEDFERECFWRAVPAVSRPLARVLYRVAPGFFRLDVHHLRRMAQAETQHEFMLLVNALRYEPAFKFGLLRGFLKVRISGRQLMRLAASAYGERRPRHERTRQRVSLFDIQQPLEEAA